jgi:probable addiction module antidote protein
VAPKTSPFGASDLLDDRETRALHLAEVTLAAHEDGNPALTPTALDDIARTRGMSEVAEQAGVSRSAPYKALREDGDPRLSTPPLQRPCPLSSPRTKPLRGIGARGWRSALI